LTLGYQYKIGESGLNLGFSTDTSVTQGEKITSNTSMKITYTASKVATTINATSVTGTFADDHDFYTPAGRQNSGACYHPSVAVFLDELFGSYMFQDIPAACNPRMPSCRQSIIMVSTGINAGRNMSSPGNRMPLPAPEAAAVVSLRAIYQSTYAYAQTHPLRGYPSSLSKINTSVTAGQTAGYKLSYVPKAANTGGKIDGYQILVEPVKSDKSTSRHFFVDETGVIRASQTGSADARSPALQ
jgi:hypothetical protein